MESYSTHQEWEYSVSTVVYFLLITFAHGPLAPLLTWMVLFILFSSHSNVLCQKWSEISPVLMVSVLLFPIKISPISIQLFVDQQVEMEGW